MRGGSPAAETDHVWAAAAHISPLCKVAGPPMINSTGEPNGGSVRVAQIRGLITQRDEDPSHIKEPADQAPARSSGLGLQARPEHPGLR